METMESATTDAAWRYRVICEDGAYVRSGLELSSRHLYTIQHDCVVEVMERCVNNQGLARLRTADGWISEMLNPLSGQRGPIVEQVPMDRPLRFRVVYGGGALVRSGVELSSSVVGTIPAGSTIIVTEKRFSNTPSYRCVPRLKLRDGSGWISMRINSPPPDDLPVVELQGLADEGEECFSFYPSAHMADGAGALLGSEDEQDEHADDDQPISANAATPNLLRRSISLVASNNSNASPSPSSSGWSKAKGLADSDKIARAFTDISLSTSDGEGDKGRSHEDVSCLVCFSSQRTATFVHGETGHIACCLECARVLKGRGDPCPVCRLPVDAVIQHFWA